MTRRMKTEVAKRLRQTKEPERSERIISGGLSGFSFLSAEYLL